ncbi:DUF2560 family protein [Serratia liquefaciens]|uniref:DUF2560 family protein n=1 Tax=Serratia liquefaciens TaxID=614 RepID=UPI0021C6BE25|nr:DUF2560 family protein [Serratia liquefaciens]HEJ7945919.1 DUF2560 family protein [Serratia liquefaciens]
MTDAVTEMTPISSVEQTKLAVCSLVDWDAASIKEAIAYIGPSALRLSLFSVYIERMKQQAARGEMEQEMLVTTQSAIHEATEVEKALQE